MALILLLPIIAFVVLLLWNTQILAQTYTIPLLFGYEYVGTFLQILTLTFAVYIVLIYLYHMAVIARAHSQNESLEQENVELKAELYNHQKDLIETIQNIFEERIDHLEGITSAKLERIAKFNEYTLEKLLKETHGNLEKYKKEAKKFLLEAEIKDESLLEKIKIWK